MTVVHIVEEFQRLAGKPGGVPDCLKFSVEPNIDNRLTAVVRGLGHKAIEGGVRIVDSWVMAFIAKLASRLPDQTVGCLRIELEFRPKSVDLESFRRRLSYLALNNAWSASLVVASVSESLYQTWESLLDRPSAEILRLDMNGRQNSADLKGKIEKNFQTWLAGEREEKPSDSERLCVLGKDFMFGRRRKPKVLREFPTGAFNKIVGEGHRVLPTYWVDLVTVNLHGELALIELKINDVKLEVMAQALDYALFFACYEKHLHHDDFLSKLLDMPVSRGLQSSAT